MQYAYFEYRTMDKSLYGQRHNGQKTNCENIRGSKCMICILCMQNNGQISSAEAHRRGLFFGLLHPIEFMR